MTNLVDTSTDTVNAEFDEAAKALGAETADAATDSRAEATVLAEQQAAERQVQIELASGMIAHALRFSIGGLLQVEIDSRYYRETADAYAVLIIKYFPGGIFALLERYKEEFGAITATLMLINVVSKARLAKDEAEAKTKEKAEQEQAKAKPKTAKPRVELRIREQEADHG